MPTRQGRERPEKILVAMHKLSEGKTTFVKYEDIVVKAFEMFPDEFALRGHPQYPDSSDIHKPLYGTLKRRGLVRAARKRFALTARGAEVAQRLVAQAGTSLHATRSPDRLTRDVQAELERMLASAAYDLWATGGKDRILDTDFYSFLGCTVRTSRNDFVGRMAASADAVSTACRLSEPDVATAQQLAALLEFLRHRFAAEIEWKGASNGK